MIKVLVFIKLFSNFNKEFVPKLASMIKLTVVDNSVKIDSLPVDIVSDSSIQSIDGYGFVKEEINSKSILDEKVVVFNIKVDSDQAKGLINQIRKKQTKVCIFLTTEEKDLLTVERLQPVVNWVLLKNNLINFTIKELTMIMNDNKPFKPIDANKILKKISENLVNDTRYSTPLTNREVEIMKLLSHGLLYKEIAKNMGISVQTVKCHLKHIYNKLNVCNRTEAILRFSASA